MSFSSFLFNGSAPPSVTTYGTSTQNMPDWYADLQKGIIGKGAAIAAEPFQKSPVPKVAGLTDYQNQAYTNTAANQNSWAPGLAQAQAFTQGSTGFNQGEFDQWKSPAIEGVVNRIADLGQRNLQENLLPSVNAAFIRGGQGLSNRHGDFTLRALRDTNESVLGQQATALQQAHDSAMSNYQADKSRQLQAGDQMGALAQMRQALGIQDNAALEAAGQAIQGQNQRNLDVANADFIEERDAPKNNVNWLSQLLGNTAVPTSTTQSSTGPANNYQPSGLSSLAGLYSLFRGMREGGAVRAQSMHRNTGRVPRPRGRNDLSAFQIIRGHAHA